MQQIVVEHLLHDRHYIGSRDMLSNKLDEALLTHPFCVLIGIDMNVRGKVRAMPQS